MSDDLRLLRRGGSPSPYNSRVKQVLPGVIDNLRIDAFFNLVTARVDAMEDRLAAVNAAFAMWVGEGSFGPTVLDVRVVTNPGLKIVVPRHQEGVAYPRAQVTVVDPSIQVEAVDVALLEMEQLRLQLAYVDDQLADFEAGDTSAADRLREFLEHMVSDVETGTGRDPGNGEHE